MVLYAAGKLPARKLVSIWNLPELRGIETSPRKLMIGADALIPICVEHEIIAADFRCWQALPAGLEESRTRNRGNF